MLSIWSAFALALAHAWVQRGPLVRALWVPEICILMTGLLGRPLRSAMQADVQSTEVLPLVGMVLFLSLARGTLMCTAAVSIHRIILLGDLETSRWYGLRFGAREWGFLGTSLMIGFLLALAILPIHAALPEAAAPRDLSWPDVLRWGLLSVVGAMLFASLAVALPARAVDRPLALRQAWQLAKGKVPGMALILALPSFAIQLPVWFLSEVLPENGLPSVFIHYAADAMVRFFCVVLLSLMYRSLMQPAIRLAK